MRASERCAGAVCSHMSAEGAGKGKGCKADVTLEVPLFCMHWYVMFEQEESAFFF